MLPDDVSPAEWFDRYFGPALFEPWARVLVDRAAPRAGERVLDLACGTGTVAREVAPRVGWQGAVVGLDSNAAMLAVAQGRPATEGAPTTWLEGYAEALVFADRSFDLVLCQQGLQFFSDRQAAAREVRRVLTPGGRFALDLWQGLQLHPLYQALCASEARHLGLSLEQMASPWSFPDADGVRALLTEAGFGSVDVIPKSMVAVFPSPERFVHLSLFAATAFLPGFDWSDETARARLIEDVHADVHDLVESHRDKDQLIVPVHWHIAMAR